MRSSAAAFPRRRRAPAAKLSRGRGIQPDVPTPDLAAVLPFAVALSLAAATFVSEDLACVTAGVLVARGDLSFTAALVGCFLGIVLGDVALMFAGRLLARRALGSHVVRRFVSEGAVARASAWMTDRGPRVIALSRFVPGTRLATYVAAGALGIPTRVFLACVTVTAIVWVPAIVSAAAFAGAAAVESGLSSLATIALVVGGGAASAAGVARAARLLAHPAWRAWRRLYGLAQRWTRWEFWPMWLFYPPIVAYVVLLMVKYRSATVFTAANPDIPGGGFIGESKFDILRSLARADGRVARAALIAASARVEQRVAMTRAFMARLQLDFPIVLKPDQGQRGSGVAIVRSDPEMRAWFARTGGDAIAQEYVGGLEFGIFYYRLPGDARGRILSVTEKHFPAVTGDGQRTLGDLILADQRAVCLSPLHSRVHRERLQTVPAAGERVALVEIGSHCRGALFLDATRLATRTLEAELDGIAQRAGDFYFGRFDVRTPSIEALTARGEFHIVELNGVTSEATHIYDPRYGVLHAYRVLMAQWRLAFEIGERLRRRGVVPMSVRELVALVRQYRRFARPSPAVALSAGMTINEIQP